MSAHILESWRKENLLSMSGLILLYDIGLQCQVHASVAGYCLFCFALKTINKRRMEEKPR